MFISQRQTRGKDTCSSFCHTPYNLFGILCVKCIVQPVILISCHSDPINIFHGGNKTENEPIRLSYQRGSHYNSIIDPHKATIGVGLGLPNLSPGGADKNLIKDAVRQSEDFQIEQVIHLHLFSGNGQ